MCTGLLVAAALLGVLGAGMVVLAPRLHGIIRNLVSSMSRPGREIFIQALVEWEGYVHLIRLPGVILLVGAALLVWFGCIQAP